MRMPMRGWISINPSQASRWIASRTGVATEPHSVDQRAFRDRTAWRKLQRHDQPLQRSIGLCARRARRTGSDIRPSPLHFLIYHHKNNVDKA